VKCKECNKEIEGDLKYLAYYDNGKPVYWEKCDSCIKEMYVRFKEDLIK